MITYANLGDMKMRKYVMGAKAYPTGKAGAGLKAKARVAMKAKPVIKKAGPTNKRAVNKGTK